MSMNQLKNKNDLYTNVTTADLSKTTKDGNQQRCLVTRIVKYIMPGLSTSGILDSH